MNERGAYCCGDAGVQNVHRTYRERTERTDVVGMWVVMWVCRHVGM